MRLYENNDLYVLSNWGTDGLAYYMVINILNTNASRE